MTAPEWYVSRQGKQYGPYPWERLAQMAAGRQVLPDDLVWGPGLASWTRADQVPNLLSERPAPPPVPAPPARSAQPVPHQEPAAVRPAPQVQPQPAPAASGGRGGLRACLVAALIGGVLLLLGAGGYLLWRYRPWQGKSGPPASTSRFPLVEYTEEQFQTRAVVPPGTAPESSGPVEVGPGAAEEAGLSDGTRVGFPGLGEGDRVQMTLEREAGDTALNLEGIQATGSARVLTLDAVRLSDPAQASARLVPLIVIPAREAGSLAPETILLARQGFRLVEGQGMAERVDFLPVFRDGDGNFMARDIWLPYSPAAQGLPETVTRAPKPRPASPFSLFPAAGAGGRPLALFTPVFGAAPAAAPPNPKAVKYEAVTYQQSINWNRKPQLVRMVPNRGDPARRIPLYKLPKFEQELELAKPVQNVFVLVHGRNEMEKSGLDTAPQIKDPWWYAYKRDAWTVFYEIFQSDKKKMLGSTVFFEFIYPSFRPVFQGDGPTAEFFAQLIKEQLKKQLDLKQSFNLFIVAHSMGGIVSRAGVQDFDGGLADNFRNLATWGSPHLGSPLVSLNYVLISPYHKLEITGPDISGSWREYLLRKVLVTNNPGTMDLRWTNGNAGYTSELRFDQMGFIPDPATIQKQFKSAADAEPVINLRHGSFFYNENLRRLNSADKYAGTDKYIFLYGITAQGVKLEWTGGVFDKGFEAKAVYQQSEIGLGQTTLWLLVDSPTTPYLGVPQGEGDGAVPILSMSGHGLGAKTVALGECDHEEYFGAPDAPGHFTSKGKASVTTRATLSNLGIGSVERYDPPQIQLKLRREEDVKALLAGDLDGDLEIEGELVWPGDANPSRRIKPDKIEAFVTRKGRLAREPVEALHLAVESGGRFRAGMYVKDLQNAGLDRKTDLELYVRLFFKDDTQLESEPLLLTGQEVLRGSFVGTIRATSVNREYLLNRNMRSGEDEMTRIRNEVTRSRNETYLKNIEYFGVSKDNGLTLSIFSVAVNSGEADLLEGKYWVDLIFRGPRLIPNDFRAYKDKRNGVVQLTLTADTFEVVKTQTFQEGDLATTMIYKVSGKLSGDTLSGTWTITENGTRTFAGTYTAKRM